MALCNVTGTVYLPSGAIAANRRIVFRREVRNITAEYLGAMFPDDVITTTNAAGEIDVNLVTGRYIAFATGSNISFFGVAVVPDAATANFADILNLDDIPDTPPVWYQQALDSRDAAETAAVDAAEARSDAEQERLMAEEARKEAEGYAEAAAQSAKFYDTIALGRAAVADGQQFGVRAGGSDGLTRPTIYRRDSATTQTVMVQIVSPTEVDAKAEATDLQRTAGRIGRGRPQGRSATPLAFGDDASVVMSAGADRKVNVELSDDSAGLIGLIPLSRQGRPAVQTGQPVFVSEDGGVWGVWRDGKLNVPLEGSALTASGLVARSGSVGTWYLNSTAISGIVGYGQSWMVSNGWGGALPEFQAALEPARVMTINDGRGVSGWGGAAPTADAVTSMTDAREQIVQWQSVVGPMALRHSYLAQRHGGEATVFTRTEARAGYSLEQLAPPDFSWHDNTITDRPYLNWVRAVQGFNDMADALGQPFELAVIPFIQGQANRLDSYSSYKSRLLELTQRMQADATAITGQRRKPQILIVQCPSDQSNGRWELLQAQVDLCRERADFTLCGAGWALPQLDNTHFTPASCVALGELFQIGMGAYLKGVPYSAPYIKSVTRSGASIRFEIGGDYSVRHETSIVTRRHYLSDLTNPVPFFGFEYSGASIISAELDSDGWGGTITLGAAAGGRLWFAGHDGSRKLSSADPDADESTNRATLIADAEIPPVFATERLTLGVASGYWDI